MATPTEPVTDALYQALQRLRAVRVFMSIGTGWRMSRIVEESAGGGVPNSRGKLAGFTQACGNKRFTPSDDSGARGSLEGPTRPAEAADGPLRGREGGA